MSKERMQQEKENTLRRILDQAWKIAIEDGVDAISIRKIASAMNFASNNLYNYFKNKNELIILMKKDSYQWAIDIIQDFPHGEKSVCTLFKKISEKLLEAALKEPEKYIVMTSDVIMDENEPLDQRLTELFAEKIKIGIAAGELVEIDPVMTAINMRNIQIGFVRMMMSNKEFSKEEIFKMHDNLMDILFNGLRRKKQ